MPIIINTPRPQQTRLGDSDSDSDSDGGVDLQGDVSMGFTKRTRVDVTAIVTPGETITDNPQWMRGHGTHVDLATSAINASVAGTLLRTNKLLSVMPLHARYTPEIGDLVVGRVAEVQSRRWRVDVGAANLATLQLSAINLPGGILRRRTDTDELQIRAFFAEGDTVVAEVQQLQQDGGGAFLHARSLRYGKLRNGVLVRVRAGGGTGGGVVRAKKHVWTMDAATAGSSAVDVVLGVNGFVWVCKHVEGGVAGVEGAAQGGADGKGTGTGTGTGSSTTASQGGDVGGSGGMVGWNKMEESVSTAAYSSQNEHIDAATMREISRVRNVIVALAENGTKVDEDTVRRGYVEAVEMARAEGDEADVYLGGERGTRLAVAIKGK